MSENKLMKTLKIGNSPTFEICDATARNDVTQLNSVLGNKVDAITGKSLISDTEISRLSKVFNYDDTLVKESIKELNDKKITKFYANSLGETTLNDSDSGKIHDMILYGKSLQDGTPTPSNPIEIQSIVNPKLSVFNSKGTKGIDIPYATYRWLKDNEAIWKEPQYVVIQLRIRHISIYIINSLNNTSHQARHIKIEDGKIKENILQSNPATWDVDNLLYCSDNFAFKGYDGNITVKKVSIEETMNLYNYKEQSATLPYTLNAIPVSSGGNVTIDSQQYIADYMDIENKKLVRMVDESKLDTTVSIIDNTDLLLETPTITDLTDEEVQAFKELTTYYPTTNVIVTSDQLDGYTTFNYPISMENGWNLIKEQLGDTREYIYDMELQSAEAYVNSEYAVTLTELGV